MCRSTEIMDLKVGDKVKVINVGRGSGLETVISKIEFDRYYFKDDDGKQWWLELEFLEKIS